MNKLIAIKAKIEMNRLATVRSKKVKTRERELTEEEKREEREWYERVFRPE